MRITLSRRIFLQTAAAAASIRAFLKVSLAQDEFRVLPRQDIESNRFESGQSTIEVRYQAIPNSWDPNQGTIDLDYFYLTIHLDCMTANCHRPIAVDLYTAELLDENERAVLSFNESSPPLRMIKIVSLGEIYLITGDFWLLVDELLPTGSKACAALSPVMPGKKVSLTFASGTTGKIRIIPR